MSQHRKLFLRTVIGLVLFGLVTMGLQAASHVITKATTRTVATLALNGYSVDVGETAVNPNDRMNSRGIHEDGYYYTCTLKRAGTLASTYIVRRGRGFRAEQVSINPMQLLKNQRLMVEVEFRPTSGNTIVADCVITPPAPEDKFGAGIVDWRALEMSGM
ncbi:MAG TPA: hypothetical protein VGK19_06620 [Capsulimonadaceae bacterium]|jgi:hypothetical protein